MEIHDEKEKEIDLNQWNLIKERLDNYKFCKWKPFYYSAQHDKSYKTSCGKYQPFILSLPKTWKYCPYCGKFIKEVKEEG